MNRRTSEQALIKQILEDAETIPVPDSLKPEAVQKTLEAAVQNAHEPRKDESETDRIENTQQTSAHTTKRKTNIYRMIPALATAACLVCAIGVWKFGPFGGVKPIGPEKNANGQNIEIENETPNDGTSDTGIMAQAAEGSPEPTEETLLPRTASSYDEIYPIIQEAQTQRLNTNYTLGYEEEAGAFDEAAPADGGAPAAGLGINDIAENKMLSNEAAATSQDSSTENASSFSTTNVQVETVDEEDMVKTDGAYLYHLVRDNDKGSGYSISIVKADGPRMEQVSIIKGLDNINGFYLQGDTLVCVEQLWLERTTDSNGGAALLKRRYETEDSAFNYPRAVSRITFFDIGDRSHPKKVSSLTTDGYAASSRISDGYFYLISQYTPLQTADLAKPSTFVPIINGAAMEASSIIIPEKIEIGSYLVVTSVSLDHPEKFADSKAILSTGDQFYVSTNHIYVADTQYQSADSDSNFTNLTMFSYQDGTITGQKSGTVKGQILDSFAMNEYNGYLRVVTTVDSYDVVEVTDDLTGRSLGYHYENQIRTNSLYVLDGNLQVVGKIEGLAEEERVYSARFMGDTGYFVTFKQIDPLFSVDLSDPRNPKILSELKISGFSEYLHFYDDNLLLGIGQEVDPDTLQSEGLKLSMFDISDPTDVKEINKLVLEEIYYTEAYSDYKAVLIDPEKNLFGFPCEADNGDDYTRQYRTFSYDPEKGFVEGIRWIEDKDSWTQNRGAFIDHIFYILQDDGNITAYHLGNNQKVGELELKKEN